jgi:ribosomal protein L11 methyltransferase
MAETPTHLRWLLDVPAAQEEALGDWLADAGACATYREADPPRDFFAYFLPGARPDPAGLSRFPGVSLRSAETFADEDWLAKSREGFGAFEVGTRFFIQPEWETGPAPAGRTPIIVNPGLAFGTGGHETTRLCMVLLEELAAAGRLNGAILDIGAGTGILALTAHLLGAEHLLAFDIDPDCGPAMAELVRQNAASLRHADPFQAFVGTLDHPLVRSRAPFQGLLANILLETIQDLLPAMASLAAPGSWLVASGILAQREDEALVSLAAGGFMPRRVEREGEWIAVLCERSS